MDHTEGVTPADFAVMGQPVYIGQDCCECDGKHYCDAVCFRFSPKVFYCLHCGVYRRHRPMPALIRANQMNILLRG